MAAAPNLDVVVLPENLEVNVAYRIRANAVPNGVADHIGIFTHTENTNNPFAHFRDVNTPYMVGQRGHLETARYPLALYTFYKTYKDVNLQKLIESKTGKSVIPSQGFGGKRKSKRKRRKSRKR